MSNHNYHQEEQQKDMSLNESTKNITKINPFEIHEQDNLYIVKRNKIIEFKSSVKSRCVHYCKLQQIALERDGCTRFPLL